MRRAMCLLIVVLGFSCCASLGQNAPKLSSPKIVATFHRFGLTAALPPTTIYTPKNWGTFRISIVLVGTEANGQQQSGYEGGILFTDEAGINMPTASTVAVLYTNARGTGVVDFPIRAKANKPIQLIVSASGNTFGSKYNVWVVVEQLM